MGVLMRVTGSAKRISGWDSRDGAEEFVTTGTFLEGNGCQDLLVGQVVVGRDDHELVVIVAPTVDDTDAEPLTVVERLGGAQEVGIEFLAVRGEGAGDVAVVCLVPEAVDRVSGTERPVDGHGDVLADVLHRHP
jgi:hypothetical protein